MSINMLQLPFAGDTKLACIVDTFEAIRGMNSCVVALAKDRLMGYLGTNNVSGPTKDHTRQRPEEPSQPASLSTRAISQQLTTDEFSESPIVEQLESFHEKQGGVLTEATVLDQSDVDSDGAEEGQESKGTEGLETSEQLYHEAIKLEKQRADAALIIANSAGKMLSSVRVANNKLDAQRQAVEEASKQGTTSLVRELVGTLQQSTTVLANMLKRYNTQLEPAGVRIVVKEGDYCFEQLTVFSSIVSRESVQNEGLGISQKDLAVRSFACADSHQKRLEKVVRDEKALGEDADQDKITLLTIRIAEYAKKKQEFKQQIKGYQKEPSISSLFDRVFA